MTTDINAVVSFTANPTELTERSAPKEGFIHGNPTRCGASYFQNGSGAFRAGEWTSTPGKWQAVPTKNEFCYILEGKVAITDSKGGQKIYQTGDAFVIPLGFDGTWEVLEPTRKYFVALSE